MTASALHQHPFHLLGVTNRDTAAQINAIAEDRALVGDAEQCERARAILTSSRNRLGAEISWLPGLAAPRTDALLVAVAERSDALREDPALPVLARANLLSAAIEGMRSALPDHIWIHWLDSLSQAADAVDVDEVLHAIDADRLLSGFTQIQASEPVEQAYLTQRQAYLKVARDALARMPAAQMVTVVTLLVGLQTKEGRAQASLLVEELVSLYEAQNAGALQELETRAESQCEQIEEHGGGPLGVLANHVRALEETMFLWGRMVRPVQMNATARGLSHEASISLAGQIREVAGQLLMKHDLIEFAQRLQTLCVTHFHLVSEVMTDLEKEKHWIDEIAAQREKERTARVAQGKADAAADGSGNSTAGTSGVTRTAATGSMWDAVATAKLQPAVATRTASPYQAFGVLAFIGIVVLLLIVMARLGGAPTSGAGAKDVAAAPLAAPVAAGPVNPALSFLPLPPADAQTVEAVKAEALAMFANDSEGMGANIKLLAQGMKSPTSAPVAKEAKKTSRKMNADGVKKMDQGDFIGAANAFHGARVLDRSDVEVADNLAYALYRAGEYADSLTAGFSTLQMAPVRANAWATLGSVLGVSGDADRATGAFLMAHLYSKAPRKTRDGLVKLAHETTSPTLRLGLQRAVSRITQLQLPAFYVPLYEILPNDFPMYFPTTIKPTNATGETEPLFPILNGTIRPEADDQHYFISFGRTADCADFNCMNAVVSGTRLTVPPTGEPIALAGGQFGSIEIFDQVATVKFVIDGITYRFTAAGGTSREAAIEMANSALKAGPLYFFRTPIVVSGATDAAAVSAEMSPIVPPVASVAAIAPAPAPATVVPAGTGYLLGAPIVRSNGLSLFTIDNTGNLEGAIGKLFYNGFSTPSRSFYIAPGESFTAGQLDAGSWVFRYRTVNAAGLPAGSVYEADPFTLSETETAEGTRYSNMRFTLRRVRGGNLKMHPVDTSQF